MLNGPLDDRDTIEISKFKFMGAITEVCLGKVDPLINLDALTGNTIKKYINKQFCLSLNKHTRKNEIKTQKVYHEKFFKMASTSSTSGIHKRGLCWIRLAQIC